MIRCVISRRSSHAATCLVALVLLFATLLGTTPATSEDGNAADAKDRPPNIVLVFTDDQGYQDVGCFGSPNIRTPNLDRMATEGMLFRDFYAAAPVCSASRAALLTGCYPLRVGITGVLFPRQKVGLNPEEHTIAEVLKSRGYATACFGKWHLGHHPEFLPTNQGFDHYYGIPYSNDMRIQHKGKSGPPILRGTEIAEHPANQSLLTKRYTEESVRFIRENRERPFFLYVPHTMPHVPLFVSEAFKGKSKGGLYGDVIEEIDWSVGQILATLREVGVDDRTLVIFTTDHGPWLSKKDRGGSALPLRGGKFTTFEGGMRVPCIVRWPGKVPAGTTCREPAGTIDLLPTFAKLAGAKLPADRKIDGKDIWPLMAGESGARSPHEAIYFYRGANLQALRVGKWKLHIGRKGRKKKNQPAKQGTAQLYDLEADISESKNVAGSHADVVERLRKTAQRFNDEIQKNKRAAGKL